MISLNEQRPRRTNFVLAAAYIPLCPLHHCDMIPNTWKRSLIYFNCPHIECDCVDKAPRVLVAVNPLDRTQPAGE